MHAITLYRPEAPPETFDGLTALGGRIHALRGEHGLRIAFSRASYDEAGPFDALDLWAVRADGRERHLGTADLAGVGQSALEAALRATAAVAGEVAA